MFPKINPTNINKWCKGNKVALNNSKTNYIKFVTRNMTYLSLGTGFDNKLIGTGRNTLNILLPL
jgi:hypothetical protein